MEHAVQQMQAKVRQRLADQRPGFVFGVVPQDAPVRGVDGRLRDAVHVDQLRHGFTVPVDPRQQRAEVQRFAAKDDHT